MINVSEYAGRAEWLIDKVKKNPEGLLLVAAGCALLLRAKSTSSNNFASQTASAVSKASAKAADYVQAASETASDYAAQAGSYATQAAESLKNESQRVVGDARTRVSDSIESIVQRQPLAIAAAGLLAGAAIATAFPPTDIERRTMGPLGEELKEAGADLAGRLSEGAEAASDRLQQEANDRGLNAEGLKKAGAEVAQAFTGALSGQTSTAAGYENAATVAPRQP